MKNTSTGIDKLNMILKLERIEISAIYFYAIFNGLIQLSLPLGIQAIIGFVMGVSMVASIYVLIFLILTGVFIVGLLQINQMKIIEKIQQKIFVRFSLEFAEKIPNLDLQAIDNYYLPEKINRFFDIINIQKGISKILLDIPIATIQIFFGLILLSLYHPLFIIFSVFLLLMLYLIFRITGMQGLETSMTESNYKYNMVAWIEEIGRVIKSFKFSQGTHLNLHKTDNILVNYTNARTSHFKVLLFQFKSLIVFKISITALMLILGTYLLLEQKINLGQFVAAEIIILAIIGSIEKLIISIENIYDVLTGFNKIYSLLDLPTEKNGKIIFNTPELKIEIRNLNFGYNGQQNIIDNLNFTIEPNSITCITGEEANGKSTLLKLLAGYYQHFSGSITFNDIQIQNYTLESLRPQMGVFLNNQDIFSGSLLENISMGKNDISEIKIMALAKILNLDSIISQFPDTFNTLLDPVGKKLTSTTIKKILLLRALVHDPILLVLEEPFEGLEPQSKVALQNYILAKRSNKTIVLTTKDADFIKKCNLLINLNY